MRNSFVGYLKTCAGWLAAALEEWRKKKLAGAKKGENKHPVIRGAPISYPYFVQYQLALKATST